MRTKLAVAVTSLSLIIGPAGVWSLHNSAGAADPPPNRFTCSASALRVQTQAPLPAVTVEPFRANPNNDPCMDADEGLIRRQTVGPVTASALFARTNDDAGSAAEAGVADVTIVVPGGPTIRAEVLTSRANAGACTTGDETPPKLTSSSTIARVTIQNGSAPPTVIEPVPGAQRDISLGPAGTLTLNQQTFDKKDGAAANNQVTQRALVLDTPVLDVVVAESVADFRGNPCRDTDEPPVPECRDGKDNDGDGKIDFPADPGCSNPDDNDERNDGDPGEGNRPPQCSDERDNDGDGLVDFPNDPGCASPQDDDEANRGNEPECSDGRDNDGDGRVDFPDDPGCENRADDDERDRATQCADGLDNDRDGSRDFPQDRGCKNAADDDEADGHVNGGGGYDEVDRQTPPEDTVTPGERLRFGTVLPCDLGDRPGPNLVTTFLDESGNEVQFMLDELTRAFCRNDPFIDGTPPRSEFDTYVGEGTGRLRQNGQDRPARAKFILQDRGEPGSPPVNGIDLYQIRVFVDGAEVANGCCTLDEGNIQAISGGSGSGSGASASPSPTASATASASPSASPSARPKKGKG